MVLWTQRASTGRDEGNLCSFGPAWGDYPGKTVPGGSSAQKQ